MIRRRSLMSIKSKIIDDPAVGAMSVVFANNVTGELSIAYDETKKWIDYPSSDYTPVGIVVIPSSHGVLKNGTGTKSQCGVMSLVPMYCANPSSGYSGDLGDAQDSAIVYFGCNGVDVSSRSDRLGRFDSITNGLLNYNGQVVTDDINSNTAVRLSTNAYGFLPIQNTIGGIPERYDVPYAPSPYTTDYKDGEYNPSYGTTSYDDETNHNVLADFKGIQNTKILTDVHNFSQNDWKTANTINDYGGRSGAAAAACCARFKTIGTKAFCECTTAELKEGKGFWYLPACGELGYITPHLCDIDDTIKKLRTKYNIGVPLSYDKKGYFSSSEYNDEHVYTVFTHTGHLLPEMKDTAWTVRAFMRLDI